MHRHWPILVTVALLMVAFPGPMKSFVARLTKPRPSPEQVVQHVFGKNVSFIRKTSLASLRGQKSVAGLGLGQNRLVCGEVRESGFRTPVAILLPWRRRTDRDPILFTPSNPKGHSMGTYNSPLAGRALLGLCARLERGGA